MASRKKTWREKFHSQSAPHVEVLEKPFGGLQPGAKLLISTPAEIDGYVRTIPVGESRSIPHIRAELARAHAAEGTCPLTTSIFLRIGSEVALEELAQGTDLAQVMPFWRVVDPSSPLAQKLSCGPDWIRSQREREGIA